VQIWETESKRLISQFRGSVSLNLQYYVSIDGSGLGGLGSILRLGRIQRWGLIGLTQVDIIDTITCLAVSNLGDVVAGYVVSPDGRTTLIRLYMYAAYSNSFYETATVPNWNEYPDFRGLANPTRIEIDGDFIHAVCWGTVPVRTYYIVWDWKRWILVRKCELDSCFEPQWCRAEWCKIDIFAQQLLLNDDKLVTVFDIESFETVTTIHTTSIVQHAAFSVYGGKSIITCHRHIRDEEVVGVINIWSMPSASLLATLEDKFDNVNETWYGVSLDASGKYLLSVSSTSTGGSTLRFWDTEIGTCTTDGLDHEILGATIRARR